MSRPLGDDFENMEPEQEDGRLILQQSHENVYNFHGKWLSHIRLRPIIVTNKLHRMSNVYKDMVHNDESNKFNELISRFDEMIIYHSGIEIILNSYESNGSHKTQESYLIFPDYLELVHWSCCNGWYKDIKQIVLKIASKLTDIATMDIKNMYDTNYGYIDSATYGDKINIHITNAGIYDKFLFKNDEFLSKACLPIDILKIICFDYIGDSHNDIEQFSIHHPYVVNYGNNSYKSLEWICHKLTDKHCDEKITYNKGINLLGTYFSLETNLHIDYYVDHPFKTLDNEHKFTVDAIFGTTSSKLSRQIS